MITELISPRIDVYHENDIFYKSWPNTNVKHTTGKSEPSRWIRALRIRDQSVTKRHLSENFNLSDKQKKNYLMYKMYKMYLFESLFTVLSDVLFL